MLRISIPSNGPAKINFSSFMDYLLPVPPKGISTGRNNNAVLLFDDEDEARDYAEGLKHLHGSQKKAGNEVVNAINKGKFVDQ
jgi:hypothetical protein